MADQAQGTNWRVADVQQTTRVTPAGRFEDVYEFTVETSWGGSFKVQVPVAGYSPDVLQALVEQEYQALTAGRFLAG
ncbi:MAG TPA: hypothetical protein VFA66_10215 [Gaiellaceae bacterium]|nr:hypothetical protein [Gaiellaceae bacterium]